MISFVFIFFIIVIVVGISAVVAFSIYFKSRNKSLDSTNQKQFDEPPPYRPLFVPTDEEIRVLEHEEEVKKETQRTKAERNFTFEKAEAVREFEKIWRGKPTKQNTIELLRLAAESGNAEIFSQTAENVIQVWNHEQAGGLSKKDLADLLDSHLRILPQQERFSGAIFWLKREIENLRRKSEAKS